MAKCIEQLLIVVHCNLLVIHLRELQVLHQLIQLPTTHLIITQQMFIA